MEQLKTRNVFVDTEFFDSIKLNLRSKTAQALRNHAEHGRLKLFLTTITVGEIKKHLHEYVSQAATSIKNIRSELAFLQSLSSHPLQLLLKKLDKKEIIGLMEQQLESYFDQANAEIVDLSSVNAIPIFEAYFNLKPPFKEGTKKHEFPDAFAMQALENWCREKHEQMYVVSRDKDWESACSGHKYLVYANALDKILDAVTKEQEAQIAEKATAYTKLQEAEIEREISHDFVDRGFYVEGEDGEVTEVVVKSISLEQPFVIAIGERETVVLIEATVTYEANVTINDVNSGYFDKEDSRWIYLPSRSGSVEGEEQPRVIVTLSYDPDDEKFFGFDVDLEDVSETVYVSPGEWTNWPIDDDFDGDEELPD